MNAVHSNDALLRGSLGCPVGFPIHFPFLLLPNSLLLLCRPFMVLTRVWAGLGYCVCLSSLLDPTLRGEGLDSLPHSVPIMLPDTADAQKVGAELKSLL